MAETVTTGRDRDVLGAVGMFVFAVVFGGFLGFVLSQGELYAGVIGAAILSLLAAIYLITLADSAY